MSGPECPACGWPSIPADISWEMANAAELLDVEEGIRIARKISRSYPEHYLPHLKLGVLFARKVGRGDKAMQLLMEKEMNEALRILPTARECHDCFIDALANKCFLPAYRIALAGNENNKLTPEDLVRLAYRLEELSISGRKIYRRSLAIRGSIILGAFILGGLIAGRIFDAKHAGSDLVGLPPLPGPSPGPYLVGINLLANGDGLRGMEGWECHGQATVSGNTSNFHVEGSYEDAASISQEVSLPVQRPGIALVIAKARSSTEPADGMTGLPFLWGFTRKADGAIIKHLSGPLMMLRAPKDVWGLCWGTFILDKEAVAISVYMQQAYRAGGILPGTSAEFDDISIFLFNSNEVAEKYARAYNGTAPSAEILQEDAEYAEKLRALGNNQYEQSAPEQDYNHYDNQPPVPIQQPIPIPEPPSPTPARNPLPFQR